MHLRELINYRYMVINKPAGMICVNNDTELVTGTWKDASERAQQKSAGQQVRNLGTFPRFLVKKYSDYYKFLEKNYPVPWFTSRVTSNFGMLHRLDKDTTGCMLVALDEEAHHNLIMTRMCNLWEKEYICLVHGKNILNKNKNKMLKVKAQLLSMKKTVLAYVSIEVWTS